MTRQHRSKPGWFKFCCIFTHYHNIVSPLLVHAFRRYNYALLWGNRARGRSYFFDFPFLRLVAWHDRFTRERRSNNGVRITVCVSRSVGKSMCLLCPTPNSKRNKEEGEWLGHKRLYRYIFSSRCCLTHASNFNNHGSKYFISNHSP